MSVSKRSLKPLACLSAFVFLLSSLACNSGNGTVTLQGAGASFPAPLYQKWVSEYGKLHATVRIDYQSIGSGGGIKQLKEQTVDFGASDAPMKDEDLKSAPGEVLHIPTVLGAVVITYNLEGVTQALHFTPEIIADVYLGKIKKWNDPKIAAENSEVTLPASDIIVVYRSDGSGTSAVFTDYLSKVSPEWKEKVGAGTSPNWPTGLGAKGNEGLTGQVKNTPNTIGYTELAYAVQNKLPVSQIKNAAGSYVTPTIEAVTAAAAASAATTPDDLRVSITNAPGADAYPISSYTYILVYKDQKDAREGKALVEFLWWGIHDGQVFGKELEYAPLPADIVKRAETKINSVTSGGTALR
jgi:phosphate transport system substrate-binding protein